MLKELRCLIKPVSIAILALGTCSQAAAEFRLHPYAAVNAGAVRLAPDPGSSGLELTEANTFGFNLLLGLDIRSVRYSICSVMHETSRNAMVRGPTFASA